MADKKTAGALKIEHPERTVKQKDTWKFLRDHFHGGLDFLDLAVAREYLIKGTREKPDLYEARAKRAFYINFPKEIIPRLCGFLFGKKTTRPLAEGTGAAGTFNDVMADVDGMGTPAPEFFKAALVEYLNVGPHWILVDSPMAPGENGEAPISQAQANEEGIRPHLVHVQAEDLLDWSFDTDGKLRFAKIRFNHEAVRGWQDKPAKATPTTQHNRGTVKPTDRILVYTRETFQWFTGNGDALTEPQENTTEVVPLVAVHPQFFGDTPLLDSFVLSNRIFNQDSEIQQASLDLIFSFLAQQGDNVEDWQGGGSDQPDEDGGGVRDHVPGRVLMYQDKAPAFVSPSADILRANLEYRAHLLLELFRMAMLQSSLRQTSAAETAEAKRRDFQDTEQGLRSMALLMQRTENGVRELVAKQVGMESAPDLVDYPEQFDVQEFGLMLEEATALQALPVGAAFIKAQLEEIITHTPAGQDPEKAAGILKEMEAAVDASQDLRSIIPPEFGA
jgi:hypothetical protein